MGKGTTPKTNKVIFDFCFSKFRMQSVPPGPPSHYDPKEEEPKGKIWTINEILF